MVSPNWQYVTWNNPMEQGVNESGNGLVAGILALCPAGFPLRGNGCGDLSLDCMATAKQGTGKSRRDRGPINRSTGSSRTDARLSSTFKTEKPDSWVMKMLESIKALFVKPKTKSCWEDFHEIADRVSEKNALVLADRNDFAKTAVRMRSAPQRKKKK